MKNRTPRRLAASAILLSGINVTLATAVTIDDRREQPAQGVGPQAVIYNGACPTCLNDPTGTTITLNSRKAEYACCNPQGFCDVCTNCPLRYRIIGWC